MQAGRTLRHTGRLGPRGGRSKGQNQRGRRRQRPPYPTSPAAPPPSGHEPQARLRGTNRGTIEASCAPPALLSSPNLTDPSLASASCLASASRATCSNAASTRASRASASAQCVHQRTWPWTASLPSASSASMT